MSISLQVLLACLTLLLDLRATGIGFAGRTGRA